MPNQSGSEAQISYTSQDRPVDLLAKNRPQQARAIKTYEGILDAASELLIEVGMERVSTNLIADRAGVTVPALYRYFPNKYAVFNALGTRLVDRRNAAIVVWYDKYLKGQPPINAYNYFYELLDALYQATCDTTGGLQIMHVLRAIRPLQNVRLEGSWQAAEQVTLLFCDSAGIEVTDRTLMRMRMIIEMGLCGLEMALDDERIEPETILRETAHMLKAYLEKVTQEAGIILKSG